MFESFSEGVGPISLLPDCVSNFKLKKCVGFGRAEFSIPQFESSRRDLENGRGSWGPGLQTGGENVKTHVYQANRASQAKSLGKRCWPSDNTLDALKGIFRHYVILRPWRPLAPHRRPVGRAAHGRPAAHGSPLDVPPYSIPLESPGNAEFFLFSPQKCQECRPENLFPEVSQSSCIFSDGRGQFSSRFQSFDFC